MYSKFIALIVSVSTFKLSLLDVLGLIGVLSVLNYFTGNETTAVQIAGTITLYCILGVFGIVGRKRYKYPKNTIVYIKRRKDND